MSDSKTSNVGSSSLLSQIDQKIKHLVSAKKAFPFVAKEYVQVFGDRHGFLPNLSVLDLLFNEGTSALSYLEMLDISFINA